MTDSTIEIDRGLISRTTQNIPLRRIQDVTVSAGILQRILGYGDISIDNASEDGGKVVLKSIDSPKKYADLILRQ
ncbi:PH domain-containing protein, partial [Escherichia coli]|nr:PH domain-containing protein [Escherichia coli]